MGDEGVVVNRVGLSKMERLGFGGSPGSNGRGCKGRGWLLVGLNGIRGYTPRPTRLILA